MMLKREGEEMIDGVLLEDISQEQLVQLEQLLENKNSLLVLVRHLG